MILAGRPVLRCLKAGPWRKPHMNQNWETSMNRLLLAAGAAALIASVATPPPAGAQLQGLEILVPAAPGGGWDQTGRAMQNALQEENLASGIQVVNIPGAGGTIGLAQFVSGKEGQGNALMTGGLVMLGAILTNDSPVTLEQVTPIRSEERRVGKECASRWS